MPSSLTVQLGQIESEWWDKRSDANWVIEKKFYNSPKVFCSSAIQPMRSSMNPDFVEHCNELGTIEDIRNDHFQSVSKWPADVGWETVDRLPKPNVNKLLESSPGTLEMRRATNSFSKGISLKQDCIPARLLKYGD